MRAPERRKAYVDQAYARSVLLLVDTLPRHHVPRAIVQLEDVALIAKPSANGENVAVVSEVPNAPITIVAKPAQDFSGAQAIIAVDGTAVEMRRGR